VAVQAASTTASIGDTGFKVIVGPFTDVLLFAPDALGGRAVLRSSGLGRCPVIGDCGRERPLLIAIEVLELCAPTAPTAGLAILDD
jgi:hypothetical protein